MLKKDRKPPVDHLFRSTSARTIEQKSDSIHNLLSKACRSQDTMDQKLARKNCVNHTLVQNNKMLGRFMNPSHACGDCYDNNFEDINSVNNRHLGLAIKYRNVSFQDCESSSSSDEHSLPELTENIRKIVPRPIFCPITQCNKVATQDSVLQHFCFEHSKIPRIHLQVQKSKRIMLTSNLTSDTVCIAVFLRESDKRYPIHRKANSTTSLGNQCKYENIDPVLLMASKLSRITNAVIGNNEFEDNVSKLQKNDDIDTSNNVRKIISRNDSSKEILCFEENEFLLLWIVDINPVRNVYKITVTSDDKKHCHSYTGNSIHIKDKTDALSIYNRSECLIIKGTAVKRLFDDKNYLQIIIKAII